MQNDQHTSTHSGRIIPSASEPVADTPSNDEIGNGNELCRWIAKGHATTYLQNKANFENYDRVLARACAEIAKVPLVLVPLENSVKNIAVDREKIQGIRNYVERNHKQKDPERLRAIIAKRLFAYRPDLEQLDEIVRFLIPFADPESKLRIPRHLGSRAAVRYAAPVLEQITADARKIIDEIVPANIKLVTGPAWDYRNRGLPVDDLIQEGTFGLHKAAQRFEVSRGYTFPTYALNWITQCITRALADQARGIRIPVHMGEFMTKMASTERRLQEELDRPATAEEIADELNVDVSKVRLGLRARNSTVSLDAPVGTESDDTIKDFIRDENALDPGEEAARSIEGKKVNELIQHLNPREQEVLKWRFGLEGRPVLTLEQVGEKFGVTRERIRQIEAKGLKKLRFRAEKMQRIEVD